MKCTLWSKLYMQFYRRENQDDEIFYHSYHYYIINLYSCLADKYQLMRDRSLDKSQRGTTLQGILVLEFF